MKFLVIYKTPVSVLEEWMQLSAEERKASEEQMQAGWNEWMKKNEGLVLETAGAGKTKRVSANGVEDIKNDIMLYSIVEAESHDAAAKAFEGHVHFQIPQATVEIMVINPIKM